MKLTIKFADYWAGLKGQKLNGDQLKYLKNEIDTSGLAIAEISRKYFIWPSSLWKIRDLSQDEVLKLPLRKIESISYSKRRLIGEAILKYSEQTENEFNAVDIQKYLINTLDIKLSLGYITSIMKKDLNYSFKRWLSRPNYADFDKIKATRWKFAVDFSKKLINNPLICNIDEWVISRSTKINYSWSIKGMNKEIKNSPFTGSMNIILSILSNGFWYLLITDKTINSNIFIHYVKKLNFWIQTNKSFGYSKVILLIDNWPSHKSKITSEFLNTIELNTCFIPTYSPDLAPVELGFAFIKRNFSKIWKSKRINLRNKESRSQLLTILKLLTDIQVKRFYSKFYEVLKSYINLY